jgi:hypothetical protein
MTTPTPVPTAPPAPAAPFAFVLIDLTTSATPDALRPGPYLEQLAAAWQAQVQGEFAAVWGAVNATFRVGSGPSDRATNEIAVNFRDTLSVQGALAYHQVVNGVPDIELGADLFDGVLTGTWPTSVGGSHEILETLGDAGANGWKDRQDCSDEQDAEELCDFVELTNYPGAGGVPVSNFLRPSFFIPGASGPWDYLGVMTAQYDVSHGYGIQIASPGSETQIGGAVPRPRLGERTLPSGHQIHCIGKLTAAQRKRKSHPYSRTYRRGVRF